MNPLWYFNQAGALAPRNILLASEFLAMGHAVDIDSDAKAARQQLLNQARLEAQRAQRDAYAAGREAGLAAASAEVIGLALDARRQAQVIGRGAVDLVMHALQHVIGQMPSATVVRGLAERALEQVEADGLITLRVAPSSLESVAQALAALERHPAKRAVQTVADPNLSDTDCVLSTPFGTVNASLSVQMDALRQALAQAAQSLHAGNPDLPVQADAKDVTCPTP